MPSRPSTLFGPALALALTACATSPAADRPEPGDAPNSAKTALALLVHLPPGDRKPSSACEIPICRSLVNLIDGAQRTIDFALYGVRDQPEVTDALRRAKQRGVKVRGVVDRNIDGTTYYGDTDRLVEMLGRVQDDQKADQQQARKRKWNKPAATCPRPAGFAGPLQCLAYDLGDRCLLATHSSREPFESNAGALMHNKFFVFDDSRVWTGSTNVSDTGTGGYNANLALVVDSADVALAYTTEFEQMFKGRYHRLKAPSERLKTPVGDATVEVLFSPQDRPIRTGVRPLLQNADKNIDIAVFYLTHKHITGDLIDAAQRGVEVRVILDATAAANGFTKHELLRAAGIAVKVENWGGKMHMKSAAIDGQFVIAGSMNWTSSGDSNNDENTLIIESPSHAAAYHRVFERAWQSIDATWQTNNPPAESLASGVACSDGVDNDHDDLVDAQDPDCSDPPPPQPQLPPWRIVPKDGPCEASPAAPRD